MRKTTLYVLLVLQLAILLVLVREVVKYEPEIYKYRMYYNLRQKGWFDKKLSLDELRGDSTMIVLTMGQSNAGNSNNTHYIPHNAPRVLCYYAGNVFSGKDPLIGDVGTGGSVWPRLADMLIDSGVYKKVIIIPIAAGSTNVQDWATGFCHEKLTVVLTDLQRRHIQLTHILWHQGEANNGSDKSYYKKQLGVILATIRRYQPAVPFYVSVATYDPDAVKKPLGVDTVIENAQKEFIAENTNVLSGANTDTIIHAIDRYDSHHFSEVGVKKYALSWMRALREKREK